MINQLIRAGILLVLISLTLFSYKVAPYDDYLHAANFLVDGLLGTMIGRKTYERIISDLLVFIIYGLLVN